MSKLETNTIDTVSGTNTLTIGSSNTSTIAFKSGASFTGLQGLTLYPAFSTNGSNEKFTLISSSRGLANDPERQKLGDFIGSKNTVMVLMCMHKFQI